MRNPLALGCLALAASILATPAAGEELEGEVVPLRGQPGYEHPERTLQRLVDRKGKPGTHHLCVLARRFKNGEVGADIYWREGNALILWEGSTNPEWGPWRSRRFLDLTRDVVPTAEDLHGSTYLLTRDWVRAFLTTCKAKGDRFTLVRKPGHEAAR